MTRYMNGKQAAEYLGITPKALWEWVQAGVVPYIGLPGRNPKYDKQDLDKIMNAHKKKNSPGAVLSGIKRKAGLNV